MDWLPLHIIKPNPTGIEFFDMPIHYWMTFFLVLRLGLILNEEAYYLRSIKDSDPVEASRRSKMMLEVYLQGTAILKGKLRENRKKKMNSIT